MMNRIRELRNSNILDCDSAVENVAGSILNLVETEVDENSPNSKRTRFRKPWKEFDALLERTSLETRF